jgi:Tol biopolymer transport system component
MDETTGFERRLAAAIKRQAGPPQPVDAMAIVDAATNERPRSSSVVWRPRWRQLFTLAVLVGLTLAAVGGALLFAGSSSPALVTEPADARPGLIGYAVEDVSEQAFSRMHVMEADGTDAREIGPGYCPTWSNDGSVMAFSASARPPSGGLRRPVLYVAAGDGTSPRIVPDIEGGALSPDGTRVAWLARTNADEQLSWPLDLRIDPISGGQGSVLVPASFSPDERLWGPTWSPDGRRIAFFGITFVEDGASYRSSIYVIDVDGSEPHRLTDRPVNDEGELWWAPDSARLAYTGLPDGVEVSLDYPASDIFVMAVETLEESNVTRSVARETGPRWSPDGSRLAFSVFDGGSGGHHVATLEVGPDVADAVPVVGPAVETFAWSPDGSRLVVGSRDTISLVPADLGESPTAIATTDQRVDCVSWQPTIP